MSRAWASDRAHKPRSLKAPRKVSLRELPFAMKFWRNEDGGLRDDISATVVVLPCFPVGDGSRNATFSPETNA